MNSPLDPTAQPASATEKTDAPSLRSENAGHSTEREAAAHVENVLDRLRYYEGRTERGVFCQTLHDAINVIENFRGRCVNGIPASNGNGGCPVA